MTAIPTDLGPPWHLPAHRALLSLAAERGLAPRHVGHGMFHFGEGARLCRVEAEASDRTPFLAAELCRSRWLTHRALAQAGLPVPSALPAQNADAAVAAAARIGGPVVLRAIRAQPPSPPTAALSAADAVAAAFRAHTPSGALVAAVVPGAVRRLVVVDGHWRPLAPETVAPHPLDRLLVERAALVCGIEFAVVELSGAEPGRPFTETGARLTAIDPGFVPVARLAADPEAAATLYLDHLFPAAADARIPLVAVLGPDSEPVTAATGAAFAATGRAVGLATGRGLAVDGLTLMTDDRRGGAGLGLLVDHGSVEAAVVELPPGGGDLGHPGVDVLVLAGTVTEADVRRLLPMLRRGVVGSPETPFAAAIAAAGLVWHGAGPEALGPTAVAACGGPAA